MTARRLALLATLCCAGPALGQTDPAATGRMMAANQLGMLEYCQGRGDVGADAVGAERAVIGRMPASAVPTDAAEALGREGTLAAPNGTRTTMAAMAAQQNTTVAALCRQMGSSTLQVAAATAQAGTAGAMPGGMPVMPGGMPAMPQMPALQGMPSMPGAPPARQP